MNRFALLCLLALPSAMASSQTVSPLFARGYTVLPEPQKVSLDAQDFLFDASWSLKIGGVPQKDVAIEALEEGLSSRFHVKLESKASATISLAITPGSVAIAKTTDHDQQAISEQAYRIELHPGKIAITANASPGLFYGVETFIQLLRSQNGSLSLPQGVIEDWPDLELRHIYWDDNHHLERVDELKRALRQAAFYKINGFVIKLDGHFQYKSAPAVVEPYALTPAELQALTDYGLRYHVQLIPYLDGPAHISFILKHPEYAKLREYPESNYEICATNPASYQLLEGMYQDLLDANKGVKYFYLSTDEPYYLGKAHNSQCNEQDLVKQLGTVGQVFVKFVEQAGGYLHDRGRTVMFWGEFPLKPSDVAALPPWLINGETYGPVFDSAFRRRGIRQMIFTSVEGEEKMFPDYTVLPQSERLHGKSTDEFEDNPAVPRVPDVFRSVSFDYSHENSDLMGEVNAGWADEGVHPETFWLGYIASDCAGWHPGSPGTGEIASSFYSLFYGPQAVNVDQLYRLMSEQGQSWTDSWDPMDSKARKPIWGSSYAIFDPPHPAHDQTLPLPSVPGADLQYTSHWSEQNSRRIALAARAIKTNDVLLGLLYDNLLRSQFNRYNLEVFFTIAQLCRQNFSMIGDLHEMDLSLTAASQKVNDPAKAIEEADKALDLAMVIWQKRNSVLADATGVWYRGWFPVVPEANGRRFLPDVDDVKDHLPGRTSDLTYLVYREKLLPFGEWVNAIAKARNDFAAAHHLPTREYHLAWDDFAVVPQGFAMNLSSTAATAASQ